MKKYITTYYCKQRGGDCAIKKDMGCSGVFVDVTVPFWYTMEIERIDIEN